MDLAWGEGGGKYLFIRVTIRVYTEFQSPNKVAVKKQDGHFDRAKIL